VFEWSNFYILFLLYRLPQKLNAGGFGLKKRDLYIWIATSTWEFWHN